MFRRVGVVGAGFMGPGIAEATARGGIPVVLYEPEDGPLARARDRVDASLERAVASGKLNPDEGVALRGRIAWTTELDALEDCDLVIEAIVEDLQAKGAVFAQLDARLAPHVLLASNTSSIPIAQLAAWTEHPERVVGLHFFSPVPVMRLVEVVSGLDSSPEAVARAAAFAAAIGKQPIRPGDRCGQVARFGTVPKAGAGSAESGAWRPCRARLTVRGHLGSTWHTSTPRAR